MTVAKFIPAKDIQPGMRIRLVDALTGTQWDTYREVTRVHREMWGQYQVGLTDGDWALWPKNKTFEVETAADRAAYAVYAAILLLA